MPSTNTSSEDSYEHWPDDITALSEASKPRSRYDSRNGLRGHTYVAAGSPEEETESKPVARRPQATAAPPQQIQYLAYPGYPPMQYAAYPAPARYGYPGMAVAYPGMGYQVYQPRAAAPASEPEPEIKTRSGRRWQGRTKAEVEEDNMKIAAREGAWEKRQVEPLGLKQDQMVWCVELDGSYSLRTFATVKEFTGEWKADPRFEDSYYFVRGE